MRGAVPAVRTNSPGPVPQKYQLDERVGVVLQPTSADARYSQSMVENVQVHRVFSVKLCRGEGGRKTPRVQVPQTQKMSFRSGSA